MPANWFSVHIEVRAPGGDSHVIDEDSPDRLMDILEEHSGVVSAGGRSWSATISVKAPAAIDATTRGAAVVQEAANRAGMPAWPIIRAEAVREDVLDEDLKRPTLPELVSVPEAAEILGVSPQRVHELSRGGRGFPGPVYELRTGKLWLKAAMVAFAERRGRTPGRPDAVTRLRARIDAALAANPTRAIDDLRVADFVVWSGSSPAEVLFALKLRGELESVQRRMVAASFLSLLDAAGLGVTVAAEHDDNLAIKIDEYLAEGHAARVYELA